MGIALRQREEDRRVADRIDDRKQCHEYDHQGLDEIFRFHSFHAFCEVMVRRKSIIGRALEPVHKRRDQQRGHGDRLSVIQA